MIQTACRTTIARELEGATLGASSVVEAPHEEKLLLTINFWLKLQNAWLN
jgi:hypothetical protein